MCRPPIPREADEVGSLRAAESPWPGPYGGGRDVVADRREGQAPPLRWGQGVDVGRRATKGRPCGAHRTLGS